jgi:NADPH:quinone reductase-like Zn-dependent oxidoreductase
MSRAVILESFGGPEVIDIREVAEPHAGPGQLRVRVAAAGLNPMDWIITANEQIASAFGLSLPTGYGHDYAGTVDEVGTGVEGFAVGDRVYGGALGRAVADYLIAEPSEAHHTPDGVDDATASTLEVAASTADAALAAIGIRDTATGDTAADDTVLIGGAAGGVGVFAVQLARLAGARVIGTASPASFNFLRILGAEPVAYGDGLVERVRALAPDGITAATDMFGTETAYAALELGASPERISTIAARDPELTAKAVGGRDAPPGSVERIAALISSGRLTVPILATYPLAQIRDAVRFQAGRHLNGKVVIRL